MTHSESCVLIHMGYLMGDPGSKPPITHLYTVTLTGSQVKLCRRVSKLGSPSSFE